MSRASLMVRTFVAAAIALVFMGCAKSNSGAVQLNALGQHPADWKQTHWVAFNQNPALCTTCHGSYTDQAQAGGTSKVSCFTCHPNTPLHPTGWSAPALLGTPTPHGATAKAVASLTGGFAHCAACHGASYNNADGKTQSCMACHTTAPHPAAPWHGSTASGTNHADTDPSNAAECAKCHLAGSHSTAPFLQPAAAGTAPGCYNNTMCHGNVTGHTVAWLNPASHADPTVHGLLGAMAAPSATAGFASCQPCHGATYAEGPYRACFACHQQGAPHPDKPWSGATPNTHALTNQGNAPVCFG